MLINNLIWKESASALSSMFLCACLVSAACYQQPPLRADLDAARGMPARGSMVSGCGLGFLTGTALTATALVYHHDGGTANMWDPASRGPVRARTIETAPGDAALFKGGSGREARARRRARRKGSAAAAGAQAGVPIKISSSASSANSNADASA